MKNGTRLFFVSVLGIFGCGDGPVQPKLEAPQITSVSESNVAQTSASISASADKSATFVIHYGETASYGKTTQEFGPAMSFTGNLSGLTPGTDIHYAVIARNAAGSGFTADRVFRTLQVPLQILSVSVSDITQTSAKVRVVTNRAANSSVEFGKTTSYGSATPTSGSVIDATHSIASLDPASGYHFRVSVSDGKETVVGVDAVFTTLQVPDACDPANVNAGKVSVVFSYKPAIPDFHIQLIPELYDCSGVQVLNINDLLTSSDGGATYGVTREVRVNLPNGSSNHRIRVARVVDGSNFDRWLDGGEFTVNSVNLTAHTDTLPPPACIPEAPCKSGVAWLFKVGSDGVVRP